MKLSDRAYAAGRVRSARTRFEARKRLLLKTRGLFGRDVETACWSDQEPLWLVFRDPVNNVAPEGRNRIPVRGFIVVNKEPAIGARDRSAATRLKQRSDEVCLEIVADCFDASGVRIVTTDAAVRAEPDDAFTIREDRVNVIGA